MIRIQKTSLDQHQPAGQTHNSPARKQSDLKFGYRQDIENKTKVTNLIVAEKYSR